MTNIDLYLDFDGVINIIGTRMSYLDARYDKAAGWNIEWRQGVIDYINSLPESVRLVWLTTWEKNNLAEEVLVPMLGITRPTITIPRSMSKQEYASFVPWWKASALQNWREQNGVDCPFIWIDDDLRFALRTGEVPDSLRGRENLLISPDPKFGITEDTIEVISEYLEGAAND